MWHSIWNKQKIKINEERCCGKYMDNYIMMLLVHPVMDRITGCYFAVCFIYGYNVFQNIIKYNSICDMIETALAAECVTQSSKTALGMKGAFISDRTIQR